MPGSRNPSRNLRRWVVAGSIANLTLAAVKLTAGLIGQSAALVADAIESITDLVGSLVVWSGLLYSARPPDDDHPYGHGKAEALATLIVAILLFSAGIWIGLDAIHSLRTPHPVPAPFTLIVLLAVIATKETFFQLLRRAAGRAGSTVLAAEALHHRADAITSLAALVGISVALIGGPAYAAADAWAALLASLLVLYNAFNLLRKPFAELLDANASEILAPARAVAAAVPGVVRVEKLRARRSGAHFFLDMHLHVDPELSVAKGHAISGHVRAALRTQLPRIADVLIHIEPGSPATT